MYSRLSPIVSDKRADARPPAEEFKCLAALLRPDDYLALMTCFQTDDCRFTNWHCRFDPAPVVFYREETLQDLAAERGFPCIIPTKDVALMRRPQSAHSV